MDEIPFVQKLGSSFDILYFFSAITSVSLFAEKCQCLLAGTTKTNKKDMYIEVFAVKISFSL